MAAIQLTRRPAAGTSMKATLTLDFARRSKSRLRATLDDGTDVAVILPRGSQLVAGELLSSSSGLLVEIRAAKEKVSRVTATDDLLLARACYHLGNRHVTLQILPGELRYLHDHVLDEMLRKLGLEVSAGEAPFEPEPGAYANSSHAHGGHHGHDA